MTLQRHLTHLYVPWKDIEGRVHIGVSFARESSLNRIAGFYEDFNKID